MKKLILLLLVNVTCYGNTTIKDSLFRRILLCLCPCIKKDHEFERKPSIHRIAVSRDLKHMESPESPIDRREVKSYMSIEKQMIQGIEEKIVEKEKQIESQIESLKNRDLLRVPVE